MQASGKLSFSHHRRFLPLLILITLLLAAVPSFDSGTAALQGDGATPEAQENAPASITVQLLKRNCPAEYDASANAGDLAALLANCIETADSVPFTLSTDNQTYPGDTRNTDNAGFTGWEGVPVGASIAITESLPTGYGNPIVHCAGYRDPANPAAGTYGWNYSVEEAAIFGTITEAPFATEDFGYIVCNWFDVPAIDAAPAEAVTIQKFTCPPNQDPSGGGNHQQLLSSCQPGPQGIVFQLTAGGAGAFEIATDAAGSASSDEQLAGDVTIAEAPPAFPYVSSSRVFCSVSEPAAESPSDYEDAGASQNQVTLTDVAAGQTIVCDWFNIPFEGGTLQKYACDASLVEATLAELLAGCPLQPDVQFWYQAAGGGGGTGSSSDQPMGYSTTAQNQGPEAATWVERIPEGYDPARAFCSTTEPDGAPGPAAELSVQMGVEVEVSAPVGTETITGNTLQITVPQNGQVACAWFNFPDTAAIALQPRDDLNDIPTGEIAPQGTGRVIITKRYCPSGFELTDPFVDRSGACQIEGPQATFSLTDANGATSSMPTNKSLNPIGHFAQWEDVPAGTFRITEDGIVGFETLGVACIAVAENTTPTSLDDAWSSENGWAEYQLPEDYVAICEWFNVRLPQPYDTGAVTVYKQYCPAGYQPPDIGQPLDYNDCQYTGPDSSFELALGTSLGPPPDVSGHLSAWFGIPGGPLSITETPPPMYETVAVYCDSDQGVDPNDPSSAAKPPPDRVAHGGNVLDWDLTDGYFLSCIWQNAPTHDAYGNILIAKRLCSEGYSFGSKTLDDLLTECAEHHTGVTFTLQHEQGSTDEAATQTSAQGAIASFLALSPGNVAITEAVPEGYRLGQVYCANYSLGDDPALIGTDAYGPVTALNDGIAFRLDPGREVLCIFFDAPTAATAPAAGTIRIYTYECPPGYGATNPGIFALPAFCFPAPPGLTFNVSAGGQQVGTGTTDNLGWATITGISPGMLRLEEVQLPGFDPPRTYCSLTLAETGVREDGAEIPVTNWGIDYDLPAGYALECVWYNLATATPSTDPSTVILHKYTCPEDFVEDQGLETQLGICSESPEGLRFTIEPSGGPVAQEQATDAAGDLQFTNVAAGGYYIYEVFNQGFIPLDAYCDYYSSAGGSGSEYLNQGTSPISLYLAGGYTLECYVFDVPYSEPVYIDILKYVCPPNYGITGAAREDVLFNCATPAPFVYFTLSGAEGQDLSATTVTDGTTSFEDVAPGALILSEHSAQYEVLKVYCGEASSRESTPPSTWQEMTVNNESIEYPAQSGTRITCYWINGELEYPSVIIHKYTCGDALLAPDPSITDLRQQCASPAQDVSFELTAEGTNETQTTDADGNAFWYGVNEGEVTVRETNPATGSVPYVYCLETTIGGEPLNVSQRLVEDYTDTFHLDGGHYVECWWFNFSGIAPADEASPTPTHTPTTGNGTTGNGTTGGGTGAGTTGGGSGGTGSQGGQSTTVSSQQPTPDPTSPATLMLTKRTCPAGLDPLDPEANPEEDCAELTDGIDFTLTALNEDEGTTAATGADGNVGIVTFDNLVAGAYRLTESLPEETHAAFIWTCASDQRSFQSENPFVPFAYAGPDGTIGVVIVPGETLECDWYDVPEAPTEVIATMFVCPGLQANLSTCEPETGGATILLTPVEGETAPIELAIDETGSGQIEVPPGTYQVVDEESPPCLIDSTAFDENGNLRVEEGQSVEVRIYSCG